MALPTDRESFKEYIMRRLGAPVNLINVDDSQVEDRIDDALSFWADYFYDGSLEIYLAHQITQDDITNQYVPLDPSIKSITRMLPLQTSIGSTSIFSLNYQFAQSDLLLSALSADSVVPLWMALSRMEFMQQVLVGDKPIRFNRYEGVVHIDMDWSYLNVGDYIMLQGYQYLDPDQCPGLWSDRWLLRYATALVKRDYGTNVSKFNNIQMPGGVTFRGQDLYDEAVDEIEKLEEQAMNNGAPLAFFVG